jgi:hypothetical protein
MTVERFDRYEEIRQQTSAAAGLPIDSDRVDIVAALKFAHQQLIEEMVGGKLDIDRLLSLSRAVADLTPPPVAPLPSVTITFVGGEDAACDDSHKPAVPFIERELAVIDGSKADLKAEPGIETKALSLPKPPAQPRSIHDGNLVKEIGGSNQYLGGFSSGRDSFGQSRWPNPNR